MLRSPLSRTNPFDPLDPVVGAGRGQIGWAAQGRVCAEQDDILGALRCFQQSLEIDIDCYEAWLGLAEVFMKMEDARRAERCFDVARRLRRRAAPPRTAGATA